MHHISNSLIESSKPVCEPKYRQLKKISSVTYAGKRGIKISFPINQSASHKIAANSFNKLYIRF